MTDTPNNEIFWLEPEDFVYISDEYIKENDGLFEAYKHFSVEVGSKTYYLSSELIGIIEENNIKTRVVEDYNNGPKNMSALILKFGTSSSIPPPIASAMSMLDGMFELTDQGNKKGKFSLGLTVTEDEALLLKLSK